jgi:MscS family membrane protein
MPKLYTYLLATLLLCLTPQKTLLAQDTPTPSDPPPASETSPDQPASKLAPPTNPRDVMQGFLASMNKIDNGHDNFWPSSLYYLDFPPNTPQEKQKQSARMLFDVLNRIGKIDLKDLPNDSDLKPTPDATPILRYQFFPAPKYSWMWDKLAPLGKAPIGSIVLQADDQGQWKFSQQTVNDLPDLYNSTLPLPPRYHDQQTRLGENLFILVGPTFQQTHSWAWATLLAAIFVGLLLGKIVQSIFRTASKHANQRGHEVRATAFDNAANPASFALLSLGLWLGITQIYREPRLADFSNNIIQFLLILAVGWFLFNLVQVIDAGLRRLSEKTESKLDDQLVPLVRKALRLFLVVVFTLFVAQNIFGLDITGWLAGLGIAGLAVSLAAQDSIKNLFGSITVLFDKPFTVGDWIVTDGIEGTVEEVGFRSTRIRTFYNSLITLPNANLINASVDNYGQRQYRRWKTHIGVQYDTTPDQLVAFTEGIRELVRSHPYTRKDYFQVWCHQFADSSLNILLYIFHEVPDWSTELRERERLFIDIVRLADSLGVQFAFPTQTVHLYKEEHKPHQTQHESPQSMTERRSMIQGIRAAQTLIKDQPWQSQTPGPVTFTKGPTDLKIDEHGNPVIEKEKED